MSALDTCPRCGKPLPVGAPKGLCPACLMGAGLAALVLPPDAPPLPRAASSEPAEAGTPSRVGPYKLLQQIGEGGMGTVWMAEQTEPVRRKVALKLIKPGMDSGNVLARFEAERQALALMDHPNIAKILDAGVTGSPLTPSLSPTGGEGARRAGEGASTLPAGRPYFVMELVKGIPITKFCDEHKLSIRERLDLFMPVCQAIQHAHQKGVIHRDIKPSNVLVALYDGKPVAKVIDFGLAKAMGQQLTERTLFTGMWAMLGTLEYMAPEQAEVNQLDIDTRSDVYSLGVLLYELLTGTTPLRRESLKQGALDEVLRRIREEEPPRPSTRLSETADRLPSISSQRRIEPAQLRKALRNDLDWIVMKCLEKDRSRRYDTANGLAMDLQRHLRDEVVVARPPSAVYRVTKLARRHKLAFASGAAVAVALGLGFAGVLWQWRRAESHRARAETNRALAEDRLYLADMNLAQQAVESRDFGTANDLLQRHRHRGREQLGWEWRYLWRRSRGDQVATLRAHSNRVWSVFFSGDSRRLVSRSSDDVVLVWDLAARRVECTVSNITAIAGFTPDGTHLVTQRSDGWIGLCNAQSGQFRPLLQETNQLVELLPDGQTILVAGGSEQGQVPVLLRNLFTGRPVFSVPADLRPFIIDPLDRGPRISPDGGRLAVVGGRTNEFTPTGFVDIWEVSSSRHLERLHASVPFVQPLGYGAGNRLAVGTIAGRVELWKPGRELAAKRESLVFQAHETYVKACVFSPDGQVLATAGSDATIKLWDTASGKLLETFEGHEGPVESLTFSSDGKWLASGGRDATVRLWVPGQRRMQDRVHGPSPIGTFTPSPDGRLLAAGFYNSSRGFTGADIKVWEVGTLREVASLTNAGDTVMFSHDNQALTTLDDAFKTWNLATLKLERTFPGPPSGDLVQFGYWCKASPDGRLVAVGVGNGTNYIFDTSGVQPVLTFPSLPARLGVHAFGLEQRMVTTYFDDGTIQFYDLARKQPLGRWQVMSGQKGMWFELDVSPDGKRVAFGSPETLVHLWDLRTRTPLRSLKGHRQSVLRVSFAPDGRRLASVGNEGTVKIWDMDLHQVVLSLKVREPEAGNLEVGGVYFLPDGNTMVTADSAGTLRFWRAATWAEIERAEGEVREAANKN